MLSLIAAMDRNALIGADNALPWRLPRDMRRFREHTLGKPVAMGRKTHESIGCPLPKRDNIVLSRQHDFSAPGCQVVHSIDEAIMAAGSVPELMVIGGANLYVQTLPRAQRLYLTFIDHVFEGDEFFPEFDMNEWRILADSHHPADDENSFDCRFVDLSRLESDVG